MTAVDHWRNGILALLMAALLASCVIDTPGIGDAGTAADPTAVAPQPTAAPPQFEPTVAPNPTAPPAPTATEVPPPEPTATAIPSGPPPLPTSSPEDDRQPLATDPGLVVVPVRNAEFMLAQTRPILQFGGHTLIYVDDELNAEVDIFTPLATTDLSPIADFDALITYLETDPAFAGLSELSAVSIAGIPTRVFEGTAEPAPGRAFVTDLANADGDLGWYPPGRMRLWVIDHPDGPVIVSAESLENPGRYSEAVRLATEILSTINFG